MSLELVVIVDVFPDVIPFPSGLDFYDEGIKVLLSHDVKRVFHHLFVNLPPQITAPYSLDLSRLKRVRERRI